MTYCSYENNRIFGFKLIGFMSNTKYVKPTESELEILQILWQKGLATVREVHEELALT